MLFFAIVLPLLLEREAERFEQRAASSSFLAVVVIVMSMPRSASICRSRSPGR
jgi:hypothetical protein